MNTVQADARLCYTVNPVRIFHTTLRRIYINKYVTSGKDTVGFTLGLDIEFSLDKQINKSSDLVCTD